MNETQLMSLFYVIIFNFLLFFKKKKNYYEGQTYQVLQLPTPLEAELKTISLIRVEVPPHYLFNQ